MLQQLVQNQASVSIRAAAQPGRVSPGASTEHLLMILLTTIVCTLLTLDQPDPVNCETAPPGSSQQKIDCYDEACADLQSNIAACEGNKPCILAARSLYFHELSLCEGKSTTSDDLVVWHNGESWQIAWPGEEFAASSVQLKFNI